MDKNKPIKISLPVFIAILVLLVAIIYGVFMYMQNEKLEKEIANLRNEMNQTQVEKNELQEKLSSISSIANTEKNESETLITSDNTISTNKLILDKSEFKNWKIGKTISENELIVIEGPRVEDEIAPQSLDIIIYKAIDSRDINIDSYIKSSKFNLKQSNLPEMSFIKESNINLNTWKEYIQDIEGTLLYRNRVYATNKGNNLCIISINTDSSMDQKYKSETDKIINKIQNVWNLDDPNNLNITIE